MKLISKCGGESYANHREQILKRQKILSYPIIIYLYSELLMKLISSFSSSNKD